MRAPSRQILVNVELLLSAAANSLAHTAPILFPCDPTYKTEMSTPKSPPTEQRKRSALTTQVNVDNRRVLIEQLGKHFGVVVAHSVDWEQRNRYYWATK